MSRFEIDFQNGGRGIHPRFLIETISTFVLSTSHPNTSYQVSSSGKKAQNRHKDSCHGGHLRFLICTILTILNLLGTSNEDIKSFGIFFKKKNYKIFFQDRIRESHR